MSSLEGSRPFLLMLQSRIVLSEPLGSAPALTCLCLHYAYVLERDEMEQWKLGAADVLADAREEVLTANFQPMEKKIEEMNTVLSVRTIWNVCALHNSICSCP